MIAYIVRRLVWGVFLLFAISFATFVIFFVIPEDRAQIGRGFAATEISLREATSLDPAPLPEQWAQYVWNTVRHFDLGRAFRSQREVSDVIGDALPVTASLLVGGTLLFLLIAIPIGVISALRPRTFLDRFLMILVLIGVSAHPVWIGLMLSYVVGFKWGLTPLDGLLRLHQPVDDVRRPGGLGLPPRAALADVRDPLRGALRAHDPRERARVARRGLRADGACERCVGSTTSCAHHVLRNAALPVVTMVGMDVGLAFAGAVFIETVYGLPGMGRTLTAAAARRDLPIILGDHARRDCGDRHLQPHRRSPLRGARPARARREALPRLRRAGGDVELLRGPVRWRQASAA